MAALAWLAGAIAGLCMVMGIVTAIGVIPTFGEEINGVFWLLLSGIFLLASIALSLGRGEYS
jgi:hypothetical protein